MQIPLVTQPTLAISDRGERFPVHRIYCVGQNFAEHAREMGNDPTRQAPFFFSKPADAVAADDGRITYPPKSEKVHHEVELVVCIGLDGFQVPAEDASKLVYGYAAGLDLTRRDLQETAKKTGRPWDMAKGFDQSAPVGAVQPGVPPAEGAISLTVNGELRQSGDINQMIWSVPEIVAELSNFVHLRAGDLIFTGTPAGVGPILPQDVLEARVPGAPTLRITVGSSS